MEFNQYNGNYGSAIQQFYSGQSIFITGGLGYLGRVLIEKLLRSCSEISTIYVLVRPKKGKNPEIRLNKMFQATLYDRVRDKMPNFREKIVALTGDLNLEDLGISENEKTILINNISIIFHVGATINFNETLKTAVRTNVHGTRYVLNLSKRMQNLKAFIHVSTLYVHCYKNTIEEYCYTLPIDYKMFINLSRNFTDETTLRILSQWPNTYTFTKAIAETLLKNEGTGLPIGIVRPGLVMPCVNEPFMGWIDNCMGIMGITTGFLCGLIRFLPSNGNVKGSLIPVDFTINAIIASAWDVFNHSSRKNNDMLIYNCALVSDDVATPKKYVQEMLNHYEVNPINNIFWLPSVMFIPYRILYKICIWVTYFPVALLCDAAIICMGRQPRIWNLYKKCLQEIDVFTYFLNKEWTVSNKNVQAMWNRLSERDQQMFIFNMKKFDWTHYYNIIYKGVRLYLFKEDDSVLESARIKRKGFRWIQKIILIVFTLIIVCIAWKIFL